MAEGKATDLQFTPDGVNVVVKQEGALGVQPTISVSTTRDTSSGEPVEIAEITGQFENVQIGDDSSVLFRRVSDEDEARPPTSVTTKENLHFIIDSPQGVVQIGKCCILLRVNFSNSLVSRLLDEGDVSVKLQSSDTLLKLHWSNWEEKKEGIRSKIKVEIRTSLEQSRDSFENDVISQLLNSSDNYMQLRTLVNLLYDMFGAMLHRITGGCIELWIKHATMEQYEEMKKNEYDIESMLTQFLSKEPYNYTLCIRFQDDVSDSQRQTLRSTTKAIYPLVDIMDDVPNDSEVSEGVSYTDNTLTTSKRDTNIPMERLESVVSATNGQNTTPIDQSDTDTSVAVRQHPLTPSISYPQLNQTSGTQNIIIGNTVRDAQSCKNLPLQVNRDGEDNDLNVDYDVMVLYAEADRSEATTYLHHLQNDISLENGESIKAVLYDAVEASCDVKLKHLEIAFTRCSCIFVYLTKNIVKGDDKFFEYAVQSCLMQNVFGNTKLIVPVFSKQKDECDFDIPFGLITLTGINYNENNDFYKKQVSSLIERGSKQRKLWAQRKKQANNPCQTELTEGRGLDNVTAEPNQLNLEQIAYSSLQDKHYEAFLAFSSADVVAAYKLWHALKEKIRITSHLDPEGPFVIGQPVFKNMANIIEQSDTTLVYLTQAALDSGFVCLEMMLALEKTQRTGKLCLHLVALDLEEEEINRLERSLPACIPYIIVINLNTNQENWEDQLISQLREPPALSDVLPVGNLAYGLVFSHYCGYLQYILPELETEIQNHEVFKKNPSTTCLKYFLLIPFSCDTEAQLEETDIDYGVTIAHEGELKCTTKHADRPRYYSISIYKATKDEKSIFFIAEFPKALYSVFQIKEKLDITNVGPRLEAQRFYHTTNHLLNHRLNKKCNNTCVLLPYADEKFSVQKVLWKAVTEELKRAARAKPEEQLVTTLSNMFIVEEMTKYDASVSCLSDDPSDLHEADSIANYLRSKKKTVLTRQFIWGQFDEVFQAKWNIFVISKQSFECGFINIDLVPAIFKCASDNRILTIPVVTGMSIDEVPTSLKWVTMLSTKEKDFKEILLNQIDGNVVHMQEKIPAGDVSTGLGLSYLLNYLPLQIGDQTLSGLDFPGRIKKLLKDEKQTSGCLPYFYAILASDGTSVDLEKDGAIPKIGQSEPIVSERAGTKGRKYYFHMYKYTQTDGQSVCFVCEVCTPGYTLNAMTKLQFAGVEAGNDLNKQIKNLGSVIEGRLQEEHYKNKVGKGWSHYFRLIRYDRNKQETLCDVIGRHLKADLENSGQSKLIYADEEEPMKT